METVKDVIFRSLETMTCAEVPVVDDSTQEFPETFSIGFGATQGLPGIQTGTVTMSTVTIIDNDVPSK